MNNPGENSVRYFQAESIWRTCPNNPSGQWFNPKVGWRDGGGIEIVEWSKKDNHKELTESEVIALIGREAVFGKETLPPIPEGVASKNAKLCGAGTFILSEEPKTIESDGPVEMAHCDKCGLGTNKWHTLCDFCLDETLNEKPQWLPVSQCDLKPWEPFWYLQDDGVRYAPSGVTEPVKWFTNYGSQITHYLRALPPYAIPKPPVKVEDDGFEEWFDSIFRPDTSMMRKKDLHDAWLASRASITEKGGDGK